MTGQPDGHDLADALEAFIRESAHVPPDDEHFHRDADLFDGGYVDSLLLVSLIAYVEDDLGHQVPTELTFHPDFSTINGMSALLRARQASHGYDDRSPRSDGHASRT